MVKALSIVLAVASLVLGVGCGEVEVSQLPLSKDFEECNGFTSNDEVATVDCPAGELRIRVSKPEVSSLHLVPFRFDPPAAGLAAEADVKPPKGSSAYGLGCAVTEAGEPGRGYLFLIVHGDPAAEGTVSIVRLDFGEDETTQSIQSLGNKRRAVDTNEPHRVRAVCRNAADGSAQLSLIVDGEQLVAIRDPKAMGALTAALAVAISAEPESEARFDNFEAGPPDGGG